MPQIYTPSAGSSSGGVAFPGGGSWISPWGQGNGGLTPVVQTLYLFPFIVPAACTVTGLGIYLYTAPSVDLSFRTLIYDNVAGGFAPNALKVDSGAIAPGAVQQAAVATGLSGALSAGIAWGGYLVTVGATVTGIIGVGREQASVGAFAPGYAHYGTAASPSLNKGNDQLGATQTGQASPPSTFGGSLASNGNAPVQPPTMFIRVQ